MLSAFLGNPNLYNTCVAHEEAEVGCAVDFEIAVAVGYEPAFDGFGGVPTLIVAVGVVVVELERVHIRADGYRKPDALGQFIGLFGAYDVCCTDTDFRRQRARFFACGGQLDGVVGFCAEIEVVCVEVIAVLRLPQVFGGLSDSRFVVGFGLDMECVSIGVDGFSAHVLSGDFDRNDVVEIPGALGAEYNPEVVQVAFLHRLPFGAGLVLCVPGDWGRDGFGVDARGAAQADGQFGICVGRLGASVRLCEGQDRFVGHAIQDELHAIGQGGLLA